MSTLKMPRVDRQTLKNKDKIIKDICAFTKKENILSESEELKPYETDGLAAYRQTPMIVVLPESTEEVSKIMSYCNKNKINRIDLIKIDVEGYEHKVLLGAKKIIKNVKFLIIEFQNTNLYDRNSKKKN